MQVLFEKILNFFKVYCKNAEIPFFFFLFYSLTFSPGISRSRLYKKTRPNRLFLFLFLFLVLYVLPLVDKDKYGLYRLEVAPHRVIRLIRQSGSSSLF